MPYIVGSCSICTPLLHGCTSLSCSILDFQIQVAVHVFQHIAGIFVQFHAVFNRVHTDFPLLRILAVACPLHNICSGVGRVRSNRNTSLVLGCLGCNGICSIAIVYKFKQLCIAVCVFPNADIRSIIRFAVCKVEEVCLSIAHTRTNIIITVTSCNQFPAVVVSKGICSPLLHICTVFGFSAVHFQILSATDILEVIFYAGVHHCTSRTGRSWWFDWCNCSAISIDLYHWSCRNRLARA